MTSPLLETDNLKAIEILNYLGFSTQDEEIQKYQFTKPDGSIFFITETRKVQEQLEYQIWLKQNSSYLDNESIPYEYFKEYKKAEKYLSQVIEQNQPININNSFFNL